MLMNMLTEKWTPEVLRLRVGLAASLLAGALSCGALGQDGAPPAGEDDEVSVTDYGVVETLAVQDTDLAEVLQMLSIQSQKNIITSKNVSGTVTANLYDVTFYEALEAILRANGYGYIEEGNFIYVYTQAEIDEIKKAQRQTVSRIFTLDHLSATDATEFITPLLSSEGQVSARGDVDAGFKPDIGDGGKDGYAYEVKLVVNDYAENVDEIASLLSELDTPPKQVLVESSILSTSLDEANAFGLDFSVLSSVDFTDLTNPLSGVGDLLAGSASPGFQPPDNNAFAGSSTVGNTTGPGGLKIGIVNDDVSVFLKLLDEVTDTTVLARPKIMALNRQRAEVLVGARVGYLSTTATETTSTQTVEFLDTGIQLVFRPFIASDGSIRMELAPSVSEAQLRTVTDSNNALITIPDEITNELTTNVRVRDGQTLVLGGLYREVTRTSRRQVPVLGDIPVVGAAFRGQDDSIDREEIIFLITPSIVQDAIAAQMGEAVDDYVEAVRVGARAGLLPFSRQHITTNHNKDAIDAWKRGDSALALYHVNNSLRLSPQQPEMIRFRDQLTGVESDAHDYSIMERVIREKLNDEDPFRLESNRGAAPRDSSNDMAAVLSGADLARLDDAARQAFRTASATATADETDDESAAPVAVAPGPSTPASAPTPAPAPSPAPAAASTPVASTTTAGGNPFIQPATRYTVDDFQPGVSAATPREYAAVIESDTSGDVTVYDADAFNADASGADSSADSFASVGPSMNYDAFFDAEWAALSVVIEEGDCFEIQDAFDSFFANLADFHAMEMEFARFGATDDAGEQFAEVIESDDLK